MSLDNIGPSLRAARAQRRWSRETLAHASGVSAAAIAQIEAGRRRDVRLSSLSALAQALELTLDQLATGCLPARAFGHTALLYGDMDEFLATAVPFLRGGVADQEHPLAVSSAARIRGLTAALGPDARQVVFADAAQWYRSPTGALEAYRHYVDDTLASGADAVRVLGEPVWEGRTPAEVAAWTRYESLLNMVFAASPITFLCPYDTGSVPVAVITGARRTHPDVTVDGTAVGSETYAVPAELLLES